MGIYATIVVMANFPLFTVSFTAGYNPTRIDEIKGREDKKWGGEAHGVIISNFVHSLIS